MTFITHGFRVSVVSDVGERVRDLGSPLRFMLRRSSLVECVSVLRGTCLQCVGFFSCMYNDWFIPKKFVIPVDHCGNHCACERDDGVATCSQTKCPDAP